MDLKESQRDLDDRYRPSKRISRVGSDKDNYSKRFTSNEEFQPRNTNVNESYINFGNNHEPQTKLEFGKAFIINTYGEILLSCMIMVALWQPSYVSLLFVTCSILMFLRLPQILQEDLEKRLQCYIFLCEVMMGILAMCFANKLTMINFDESKNDLARNWGIVKRQDDPEKTNMLQTFFFELAAAGSLSGIWYISTLTYEQIYDRRILNKVQTSYLRCRKWSEWQLCYQFVAVAVTLLQLTILPNFLALPILLGFLLWMICFCISRVNVWSRFIDQQTESLIESSGEGWFADWIVRDSRFMLALMTYQKLLMFTNIIVYIYSHIYSIQKNIPGMNEKGSWQGALGLLRVFGLTEYQTLSIHGTTWMLFQMVMTIFALATSTIWQKSFQQLKYQQMLDQKEKDDQSQSSKDPTIYTRIYNGTQLLEVPNNEFAFSIETVEEVIFGYMPVVLTQLIRVNVFIFAYMYNSYIGFANLIWVVSSFPLSSVLWNKFTIYCAFPCIFFQFSLVYLSNISEYSDEKFFRLKFIQPFIIKPERLPQELFFMYCILIMAGLMIPAAMRQEKYYKLNNGSDMIKDFLIDKIKDPDSNVFWKFLTIFLLQMQYIVLFLMLFLGQDKFSLFQIGFMVFFVVYGASDYLLRKTSILLPMFVSFFILARYHWTLVWMRYPDYEQGSDFLNMVDGWQPPADYETNRYWVRMPDFSFWILLFLMTLLHSITKFFPDTNQNSKFLDECYVRIRQRYSILSKWLNRIFSLFKGLLMILVIGGQGYGLIRQAPNIPNFVFMFIFLLTFGKLLTTSETAGKLQCKKFAEYTKIYSALILFFLLTYHVFRFELKSQISLYLDSMLQNGSVFAIKLEILGLYSNKEQTLQSVHFYIAYMISSYFIELHVTSRIYQQDSNDLFDWDKSFKTYKGVTEAYEKFRFNNSYIIYKLMGFWNTIDIICMYSHLFSYMMIVLWCIGYSVSLYFAINLTIIVLFYWLCIQEAIKIDSRFTQQLQKEQEEKQKTKEQQDRQNMSFAEDQINQEIPTFDLQKASDLSRKYKKEICDAYLRVRMRLWYTQYYMCLFFLFLSYICPLIDQLIQAQQQEDKKHILKTVQFWLFWTGVYYPQHKQRIQPVHVMFFLIIIEKQAQNWLYNRFGTTLQDIKTFTRLNFYRSLKNMGKDDEKNEWCCDSKNMVTDVLQEMSKFPQEQKTLLNIEPRYSVDNKLIFVPQQFTESFVTMWHKIKARSREQYNLMMIRNKSQTFAHQTFNSKHSPSIANNRYEEMQKKKINTEFQLSHNDMMTLDEICELEQLCLFVFKTDLQLQVYFDQMKINIEGTYFVLYINLKHMVEYELKKQNILQEEVVPFLPLSDAKNASDDLHDTLLFQYHTVIMQIKSDKQNIAKQIKREQNIIKQVKMERFLSKMVDRKYRFYFFTGTKLIWEQLTLGFLLFSCAAKCNIISFIYLGMVLYYLLVNDKQKALLIQARVITFCILFQYWLYLLNLNSVSSPAKIPNGPYPSTNDPYGQHIVPVFYKFEFFRNLEHAYFFAMGTCITTISYLWLDFINLAVISIFFFYFYNPILKQKVQNFTFWNKDGSNKEEKTPERLLDIEKKLTEYHDYMKNKYSQEKCQSIKERLKEMKARSHYYQIIKNGRVLLYTTGHIFSIMIICVSALCRRSILSALYVFLLFPYIQYSSDVLKQYELHKQCQADLDRLPGSADFQAKSESEQKRFRQKIIDKYQWTFIKLINFWLSIFSFVDLTIQVIYQVPYLYNYKSIDFFGLRKIYDDDTLLFTNYSNYISGNYQGPQFHFDILLAQMLSGLILQTISTQSEIFGSKGYKDFISIKEKGLGDLMKLANYKRDAITFAFNNEKMLKILAIQKTQQQILATVQRLKVNVFLWRMNQKRQLMEEFARQYGTVTVPPPPNPKLRPDNHQALSQSESSKQLDKINSARSQISRKNSLRPNQVPLLDTLNSQRSMNKSSPRPINDSHFDTQNSVFQESLALDLMDNQASACEDNEGGRLSIQTFQKQLTRGVNYLQEEKQRKIKQITKMSDSVCSDLLPFRAQIYLYLKSWSRNYLFHSSMSNMEEIRYDNYHGKQNDGVDLIELIKLDLDSYLTRNEEKYGGDMNEWPKMELSDLRQTKDFCMWDNIMLSCLAAITYALISNTQKLAYFFMLLSIFTNAGLISIVYPLAVFGYALLEETRPSKLFWRIMLYYSIGVVCAKCIMNLQYIEDYKPSSLAYYQQVLNLGLHHVANSFEMLNHMMPEILILTSILFNEIISKFTGLYETSETEVEDIPQAIDRIFENQSEMHSELSDTITTSRDQVMEPVKVVMEPRNTFGAAIKEETSNLEDDQSPQKRPAKKEMDVVQTRQSETSHKEEGAEGIIAEMLPPVQDQFSRPYFKRLFPSVQQQKPGTDFYGLLTTVQFIISVFLITRFNSFASSGPFQTTNIFPKEMIVVLIFQVLFAIAERYCARHDARITIEKENKTSEAMCKAMDENELFKKKSSNDMVIEFYIQKLRFQDLREMQSAQALYNLRELQDTEINQTHIEMTIQQKLKFCLHWINLIIVHIYVFWYVPIESNLALYGVANCSENLKYGCKEFRYNANLQKFYALYCVYFMVSAAQISHGLPSFKRASSAMQFESHAGTDMDIPSDIGNIAHQIFVNMPLAVEIRCVLDFAMSKTALDMWQTMQLFQYQSDFYVAKTSQYIYNERILGQEVYGISKIMLGYIASFVIVGAVIGPFILFSELGGMTMYNPVLSSDVQFWIQVNSTEQIGSGNWIDQMTRGQQTASFKVYQTETPNIFEFSQELYDYKNFTRWPETKYFDPEQVQLFVPNFFSDTTWIASDEVRSYLQKHSCIAFINAEKAIGDLPECDKYVNQNTVSDVSIGFQIRYSFTRQYPSKALTASGIQQRNIDVNNPVDALLLTQMSKIMTEQCLPNSPSQTTLNITNFYNDKVLLGEGLEAMNFQSSDPSDVLHNIILTYKCKDQWAIGTDDQGTERRIEIMTFSQQVSASWLQGYNMLTFYTGLIFVLGFQLRPVFMFITPLAYIYEINYADPILRLCESVHLERHRGNLVAEETNYRMIQEIVRSHELLHLLTGSNMKGKEIAPSDQEQHALLIPKAYE